METILVACLFVVATAARPGANERFQNQILDHTPVEQRASMADLVRRHAALLQPNPGPHRRMPLDPEQAWQPEPEYRKQNKADSMFNTPLFCLKHADGYQVVQDFWLLNEQRQQEPIKFKKTYETLAHIEKEQP